jgi:adhesin transport system outer membrane protein
MRLIDNKVVVLLLRKISICLIILSITSVSFADTRTNNVNYIGVVPLEDVLKELVITNPEILEALRRYESIKAEIGASKSGFKPNISAEASIGPEVTKGYDNDYERTDLVGSRAGIYARQNIFSGMHTSNYVKETEARIKAAAYDVLDTANEVFLQATAAYLDVLKAAELLELSRQNVNTQAQILRQIKEKTDSGFGRASDLSNSESRFALSRSNYISRQQDLNQAVVKFHRQFGRILLPNEFIAPKPINHLPKTMEEAINIAFHVHPALKVANYNIEVRKHTLEKDKSAYWPSLDLELKAEHANDMNGNEGWKNNASAFLTLSYTLYDGGVRGSRKASNYESMLKEYERSYIERRNVNELVGLAWNIYVAEESKKVFLNEHVSMSERTLGEFKEEYHLGRRTLLELLDMESEYYSARNSFTESEFSHLVARYRLSQATGVLLHEFDTGLYEKLDLEKDKDNFNYDLYKKIGEDRDQDTVRDIFDQCDASLPNTDSLPWGCFGAIPTDVGYNVPNELSPYVTTTPVPAAVFDVDEDAEEQSFHIDKIYFKFDSAELTPEAMEYVTSVAEQFKTLEGYDIKIIGHTDNWGSEDYNNRLSEKRANSVKNELINQGVNADILESSGMGFSSPYLSNDTLEGRQKNRRIEFKLIKK